MSLTPQEIVNNLNKYIVGQAEAKKCVAVALRNRWRRMNLPKDIRDEIMPKNILMIGPTGVGKTEIARRLAGLSNSPFIKVEATKFTEVGYVGRDVEQIIRDLVEVAIHNLKKRRMNDGREKARTAAISKVIDVIAGRDSSDETKQKFRDKLDDKEFTNHEIEVELKENATGVTAPMFDMPGGAGQFGMINLGDIVGKALGSGKNKKLKKVRIHEAIDAITEEELENMMDQELIVKEAIRDTEENGIVFIDEIDKVCGRNSQNRGDVSREGVQRDLLPIVEGSSVSTRYGIVKTDFILFIASGAFHSSKPSDLLPELQGRFPIRVELNQLTQRDFIMIMRDPHMNLIEQAKHLLSIEGVELCFEDEAIDEIANIAYIVNSEIENIGARRLNTIISKILDEINFNAPELNGQRIVITKQYVDEMIKDLSGDTDLSRFIL